MKKAITFLAVVSLFLIPTVFVQAADFTHGDTVSVPEQQIVTQNYYAAGGQVTISTTAQKDLILAGGRVITNGPVWGDVLAAGGTVDILKDVRGDIRVAGGQVTIQGVIGGDVTVAGGQVTILPGTTIAGDLIVAGGQIQVDGAVNGQTKIYGGKVSINNVLAGPVYIAAKDSVTFGEKASLGSTLTYRAPSEAMVTEGAKLGDKVTFTKLELPQVDKNSLATIVVSVVTALAVLKLISLALAAVVAVTAFKGFSLTIATESLKRFPHMALVGLGVAVAGPVLSVLLIVTVIGWYIGVMVAVVYVLALILGGIYLNVIVGGLVAKLIKKEVRINWKWALVGTVVVFIVGLVPFVGWLAIGLMYLAALGTITSVLYREMHTKNMHG